MHLLVRSYGRLCKLSISKNAVVNLVHKVVVYTVEFAHLCSLSQYIVLKSCWRSLILGS